MIKMVRLELTRLLEWFYLNSWSDSFQSLRVFQMKGERNIEKETWNDMTGMYNAFPAYFTSAKRPAAI